MGRSDSDHPNVVTTLPSGASTSCEKESASCEISHAGSPATDAGARAGRSTWPQRPRPRWVRFGWRTRCCRPTTTRGIGPHDRHFAAAVPLLPRWATAVRFAPMQWPLMHDDHFPHRSGQPCARCGSSSHRRAAPPVRRMCSARSPPRGRGAEGGRGRRTSYLASRRYAPMPAPANVVERLGPAPAEPRLARGAARERSRSPSARGMGKPGGPRAVMRQGQRSVTAHAQRSPHPVMTHGTARQFRGTVPQKLDGPAESDITGSSGGWFVGTRASRTYGGRR
jgi:hypothetical protein